MVTASNHSISALEIFWRGFRRLCPRCGEGRMFAGYLSVREACDACKMPFEPLRSDDAPPYFTLFIVGHVVISLYLLLWPYLDLPEWGQALVWCGLTLVLSLVLLPFVKGGVMAVIFRTKAKG
ncbi:MAG TPA: DUF983 domain-containing protein [Dongiaceae bacterium]|nr:DUF983 domain-containing protein [Dongiaceae bacterium]